MRTLLLTCLALAAAAAIPAVPASAEDGPGQGFTSGGGFGGGHGHGGFGHGDGGFGRDHDRGFGRDRRDNRRDRNRGDQSVFLDFSRGYYDDLLDDRTWRPDSYNDWWHERTSRSYPRWMQNNRNCERMWWSGGGWTC